MKKQIILLSIITLCSISGAMAQSGFKITGKIPSSSIKKVLLISNNLEKNSVDTLCYTKLVDGNFELVGSIDALRASFIVPDDQSFLIPLMLENSEFTVAPSIFGFEVKGGGQEQGIFNQYISFSNDVNAAQMKIETDYKDVAQKGDKQKMKDLENQFNQLMQSVKKSEVEFVKVFANNYVTAYILAAAMPQIAPEELVIRYNLLGDGARNTPYGRKITSTVKSIEATAVGKTLADFVLLTPEGSKIALSHLQGKVKLIEFWASWSEPCRKENLNTLKLSRSFAPKDLSIFGVSFDDKREVWVKAIGEDGLNWVQGSDLLGQNSPFIQQFFIQTVPFNILLDKNNVVVAKNLRGEALKAKIEELLKNN